MGIVDKNFYISRPHPAWSTAKPACFNPLMIKDAIFLSSSTINTRIVWISPLTLIWFLLEFVKLPLDNLSKILYFIFRA